MLLSTQARVRDDRASVIDISLRSAEGDDVAAMVGVHNGSFSLVVGGYIVVVEL